MAEGTEKKASLFREKNLERIETPEKLNDYLRVTSPGVWLLLGTVIAVLIGICIFSQTQLNTKPTLGLDGCSFPHI